MWNFPDVIKFRVAALTISEKAIRYQHPDYNPDRAQKLISSSTSWHLSTRNISSKSMHAFLSNLAHRQTDRQMDRQTKREQTHLPPPLSEVNNGKWGSSGRTPQRLWLCTLRRLFRLHCFRSRYEKPYWYYMAFHLLADGDSWSETSSTNISIWRWQTACAAHDRAAMLSICHFYIIEPLFLRYIDSHCVIRSYCSWRTFLRVMLSICKHSVGIAGGLGGSTPPLNVFIPLVALVYLSWGSDVTPTDRRDTKM